MTDDEIIKKFAAFTRPCKDAALNRIAFSGTQLYATDGRIAVDGMLSTAHKDEIPEKYPIESLREVLAVSRAANAWHAFRFVEFEKFDRRFAVACDDERREQLRNYRMRYTEEACPCCNDTVYWDAWEEKLVREKEEMSAFDVRDLSKCTRIRFANGESVLVNFCYLHLLVKAFGRDLLLAIGRCTDEKNPMLCLKTVDGRFYGALMPMRSYDGTGDEEYTLYAEPIVQKDSVVPAVGAEYVRTTD